MKYLFIAATLLETFILRKIFVTVFLAVCSEILRDVAISWLQSPDESSLITSVSRWERRKYVRGSYNRGFMSERIIIRNINSAQDGGVIFDTNLI